MLQGAAQEIAAWLKSLGIDNAGEYPLCGRGWGVAFSTRLAGFWKTVNLTSWSEFLTWYDEDGQYLR